MGRRLKFIDLFAGIGGIRLAFERAGATCVWSCENNKDAIKTYEANFGHVEFPYDIQRCHISNIPEHDILTAGFPCQPFSNIGKRAGFADTRGTLFDSIVEILLHKAPKAFLLENVPGLVSHDSGRTLNIIKLKLISLGYIIDIGLLRASDFGLPTQRERLFIVGFLHDVGFKFPKPVPLRFTLSDVFNGHCEREIAYSVRVGGRGSGIHDRHNWDAYYVGGQERRLTVREVQKIMGFPDWFKFPVSDHKAMKQLGNSVAIDTVYHIALEIIKCLPQKDDIPRPKED